MTAQQANKMTCLKKLLPIKIARYCFGYLTQPNLLLKTDFKIDLRFSFFLHSSQMHLTLSLKRSLELGKSKR